MYFCICLSILFNMTLCADLIFQQVYPYIFRYIQEFAQKKKKKKWTALSTWTLQRLLF